jgi:predicted HicB family RNase H-like nuclease
MSERHEPDPVFTIRLPQDLRERIGTASHAEGVSLGEWLRRAAEERLSSTRPKCNTARKSNRAGR